MKRKIESQLLAWKEKETGRMPLILGGARQIGKTYILREFGRAHFKNTAYLNLETNQKMVEYFQDGIVPERLLRYISALTGERILPGQTLIILDEIQACERALTALKYFCEQMPAYHIAASGSLLGVAVNRQNYSFPVGRVASLTLHPFDFEEYLWAKGENELAAEIRQHFAAMTPMPQELDEKAAALYREYLLVGGMPASILQFLQTCSYPETAAIGREILENYTADMAKYATAAETVQIRSCYSAIPAQLTAKRAPSPAQQFGGSISWLKFAGIVLESRQLRLPLAPAEAQVIPAQDRLYFSDVGLLAARAGITPAALAPENGGVAGRLLAQNYLAQQFDAQGYCLYFWQGRFGQAAPFLLQRETGMAVVLPEPGSRYQAARLASLCKKYPALQPYCFGSRNFTQENGLACLPMYAAFCL